MAPRGLLPLRSPADALLAAVSHHGGMGEDARDPIATTAVASPTPSFPALGAIADGIAQDTGFAVWAPHATRAEVVTRGGERVALEPGGAAGVFAGRLALPPGTDYGIALDGGAALPDPCSREQPAGIHGLSRVVDRAAVAQLAGPRRPVALAD